MGDADRGDQGPILAVVADNTRIYSQLLADALKRDRRIQVVGVVSSARELFDIVAKIPVHVAIISSNLDEEPSRGFDVLRELHRSRPAIRGVMLLDSSKRETIVEAFRAGAMGIFSKHESWRSLCKCIRCVHEGQIWANSKELKFALEALTTTRPVRAVDAKGISLLSKRELQVVQALAEGLTNREIGDQLKLSRHTVKNYLLRIFDKVGVSNRMELLFLTLGTPATEPRKASYESKVQESLLEQRQEAHQDAPPQFKLPQIDEEGVELSPDRQSAYIWCLLSEATNPHARDQLVALRKKIAESMTAEQISAAEQKAADWSNSSTSKKPSSLHRAQDAVGFRKARAKVFSAD
ncbi:MAG: hypothetical protein DMG71_02000 [Acidobacteria bacterium]|nr:MAG: hypothetical protein DMG71_02000 [Acidobacteriota bacterium]